MINYNPTINHCILFPMSSKLLKNFFSDGDFNLIDLPARDFDVVLLAKEET